MLTSQQNGFNRQQIGRTGGLKREKGTGADFVACEAGSLNSLSQSG